MDESSYRAYAGNVVNVTLCGGLNVRVSSPGIATKVLQGGEAGDCASCEPITFARNSTVARDYNLRLLANQTDCGPFSPTYTKVATPTYVPNVACVSNCSTNHVSGGTIVVDPVSFMVSLQYPHQTNLYNTQHFCGGTLITPGVVLTAAHCVAGDELIALEGRMVPNGMNYIVAGPCGGYDQCITALIGSLVAHPQTFKKGQGRLTVVEWSHHPNYSMTDLRHDVALLRIAGDFDYSQTQFALGPWSETPMGTEPPPGGSYLSVLGWGATRGRFLETDQTPTSETLQNGTMPYVDATTCQKAWSRSKSPVQSDIVCTQQVLKTGTSAIDACVGDSGGPLLLMGGDAGNQVSFQVGIVSGGVGRCDSSLPGVYASIADTSNMGWITQQLSIWKTVPPPELRQPVSTGTPEWLQATGDTLLVLLPLIVALLNLVVALIFAPRRVKANGQHKTVT